MRLILMGTGPFAVPAFDAIRAAGHELACVFTRPTPAVKSRKGPPPNPVRQWAESNGLKISAPESVNAPETIEHLIAFEADLLVVCDYGQILRPEALATSKLGGINLHGSLLPKYRGAAPVQRALLSGEAKTGVTVIHMTPRLDGGPILGTAETLISDDETSGDLEERLSMLGVDPTLKAIEQLRHWDTKEPIGITQNSEHVTKAPRLLKSEALIDWSKESWEVDVFVRGMQPWPIAYTFFDQKNGKQPLRLAVKKVSVLSQEHHPENKPELHDKQIEPEAGTEEKGYAPGAIVSNARLIVQTGDGLIEILCIQPAGKREMTGVEFARGYQPELGSLLS